MGLRPLIPQRESLLAELDLQCFRRIPWEFRYWNGKCRFLNLNFPQMILFIWIHLTSFIHSLFHQNPKHGIHQSINFTHCILKSKSILSSQIPKESIEAGVIRPQ